ncbi:hypothetical protein BDA96_10G007000 [Sorghum bicolor]|uniref:Uncharacterized protein n=1 Tax=Sorghum bicolor TaxID=4558 RepID=A0A921TYZ0_SORBI|nr:hypothetical protein BDA96_10G007000 [Sorghum bicolor]
MWRRRTPVRLVLVRVHEEARKTETEQSPRCRPSAAAALVVAPPAAALLRRLRCRCCEDTLGVPRRRLQQLPAVPGLQVDRPPVRGTRQPRQRRRARHADRRRREVQYSLLVHHTADELRAFGLTDEMLQDQMWQKTARPEYGVYRGVTYY